MKLRFAKKLRECCVCDCLSALLVQAAKTPGSQVVLRPGPARHTYFAVLVDEHGQDIVPERNGQET
jgi:hypothetical protein